MKIPKICWIAGADVILGQIAFGSMPVWLAVLWALSCVCLVPIAMYKYYKVAWGGDQKGGE